jgi:hypothetical protein
MNDRHLSQADIIDIAVFSDLRESLTGIWDPEILIDCMVNCTLGYSKIMSRFSVYYHALIA